MTFKRVKELEAQVEQLQKDWKVARVDSLMMESYLREKGLFDDYINTAALEIREAQAVVLRRRLKVVDSE